MTPRDETFLDDLGMRIVACGTYSITVDTSVLRDALAHVVVAAKALDDAIEAAPSGTRAMLREEAADAICPGRKG